MRRCGKYFQVAAKCIRKRGHKGRHKSGFEKKRSKAEIDIHKMLNEAMKEAGFGPPIEIN